MCFVGGLPCCAKSLFQRTSDRAELDSGLSHQSLNVQQLLWHLSISLLSSQHAQVVHKCAGRNEANSRSGMAGVVHTYVPNNKRPGIS
jgi:hypothetical protein